MKIKKYLTTFFIFVSTLFSRILYIGKDAVYIDESNLIKGTKKNLMLYLVEIGIDHQYHFNLE